MTTNIHRYQLQPYKTPASRYACPQCSTPRSFTRYIDTQSGQQLAHMVGRCSRENNCGYHYTPKQYFTNHPEAGVCNEHHPVDPLVTLPNINPSTIATQDVLATLNNYGQNNLVQWLNSFFNADDVADVLKAYRVGTTNHWPGATVFWQIDEQQRARTGKIMLYNAQTGKRVKQPYNHIHWMHKKLYAGYYLSQCLFGLHLIDQHPNKPIAIVESEKTALLAALHLPQYLWLATGGLHNLNAAQCQLLKGRRVMLYPDVKAYDVWQQKAHNLQLLLPGTIFKVDDMLERNATPQQHDEGWDLGDWLVGA
ncbi:DUF6371 domain-containing protein [Mucilaginibacter auburnensis]|nr:DUF6371 domain-containing protein [Mucilaginibacter auburnensis]